MSNRIATPEPGQPVLWKRGPIRDEYIRRRGVAGLSRITVALLGAFAFVIPLPAQCGAYLFSAGEHCSALNNWNQFDGLSDRQAGLMHESVTPQSADEVFGGSPSNPLHTMPAARFQESISNKQSPLLTFGPHDTDPTVPETGQAADGGEHAKPLTVIGSKNYERPDFNRDIYYRNRLEFGLDVGWHPVNIPFIYDFALGGGYNMTPLKYTLVPVIASLRWHVTNVGWRGIFRGNMDFTFSGSVTSIPRGPESRYYSFMFGIRRNFVHPNWKFVPYFDQRGGIGNIDAKGPLGVLFSQGQNLTFTYTLGVGVRYNFDSKYSLSGGMNYMHISNGYLSQPQFMNYGINVYGPIFGFDMRLGKPHHYTSK